MERYLPGGVMEEFMPSTWDLVSCDGFSPITQLFFASPPSTLPECIWGVKMEPYSYWTKALANSFGDIVRKAQSGALSRWLMMRSILGQEMVTSMRSTQLLATYFGASAQEQVCRQWRGWTTLY